MPASVAIQYLRAAAEDENPPWEILTQMSNFYRGDELFQDVFREILEDHIPPKVLDILSDGDSLICLLKNKEPKLEKILQWIQDKIIGDPDLQLRLSASFSSDLRLNIRHEKLNLDGVIQFYLFRKKGKHTKFRWLNSPRKDTTRYIKNFFADHPLGSEGVRYQGHMQLFRNFCSEITLGDGGECVL